MVHKDIYVISSLSILSLLCILMDECHARGLAMHPNHICEISCYLLWDRVFFTLFIKMVVKSMIK